MSEVSSDCDCYTSRTTRNWRLMQVADTAAQRNAQIVLCVLAQLVRAAAVECCSRFTSKIGSTPAHKTSLWKLTSHHFTISLS